MIFFVKLILSFSVCRYRVGVIYRLVSPHYKFALRRRPGTLVVTVFCPSLPHLTLRSIAHPTDTGNAMFWASLFAALHGGRVNIVVTVGRGAEKPSYIYTQNNPNSPLPLSSRPSARTSATPLRRRQRWVSIALSTKYCAYDFRCTVRYVAPITAEYVCSCLYIH